MMKQAFRAFLTALGKQEITCEFELDSVLASLDCIAATRILLLLLGRRCSRLSRADLLARICLTLKSRRANLVVAKGCQSTIFSNLMDSK